VFLPRLDAEARRRLSFSSSGRHARFKKSTRLLLGMTALLWWASQSQALAEYDWCSDVPRASPIRLSCRDGDPKCDMDGACDGTCTIQLYGRTLPRLAPNGLRCYIASRLSTQPLKRPWHSVSVPSFLPVGMVHLDGEGGSLVRARCRTARTSCVPPPNLTGHVAITGDVAADFTTEAARTIADDQPAFHLLLSGPGGFVYVTVYAVPQEGTYRSGEGLSVQVSTPDAHFWGPADPGEFVGALTITAVEPSSTAFKVMHGHFEAVLRNWIGGFSGGFREIAVQADF
jgi:hypothetical protein